MSDTDENERWEAANDRAEDMERLLAQANRDKAEMLALLKESMGPPESWVWLDWRIRVAALLKRLGE